MIPAPMIITCGPNCDISFVQFELEYVCLCSQLRTWIVAVKFRSIIYSRGEPDSIVSIFFGRWSEGEKELLELMYTQKLKCC